jgi:hypothetical protein
MGDVGNFLFGGSKQKNSSNQQSQSSQASQNQSTSNQGSTNVSQQVSSAGNVSSNRAYDPLAASLTPSLGYVSSAGNMLGALLGLPTSTFNYATAPVPSSAPMPNSGMISMDDLAKHLDDLKSALPAPVTAPAPSPSTNNSVPSPTGGFSGGTPTGTTPTYSGTGGNIRPPSLLDRTYLQRRETGGPVAAGTPYLVGEKQPEVFVPNQSGTIVPSVQQYSGSNPYNPSPGSPTDAVNTFANSAGMNFMLDQGQKALSGASAANGVFNSGATGKALTQFGQNLGKSYLDPYMNHLLDYAKLGLGSASALSGAGGTSVGQSAQSSGSLGSSFGNSQSTGSSTGLTISSGTSSGSGNSKKGLVPDILG